MAAIIALTAMSLSAQKKGNIVLSLDNGLSVPVGRFGDNKLREPATLHHKDVGNALMGYQLGVSGSYFLNNHIGVVLKAGFSVNPQDESGLKDYYLGTDADKYIAEAKAKPWKVWRFLGGLSFNSPVAENSNYFVQFKALAGFAKTKWPGHEITAVANNAQNQPSAFSVKMGAYKFDPAFAWQAEAGVGCWLGKSLFVVANVDYFDASPSNEFTVSLPGSPYYGQKGSFDYKLSSVGINLTAGWRFGK